MTQNRGGFQTKLGVVLATAGSAVGLGNIWRFPYMTGQNGGAAFILIYIGCVLLLGIPGMVSEFIVGRHSSANAARAYRMMPVKGPWGAIGYLGVFTSIIILGFYAVVAGWCMHYFFASLSGQFSGDAAYVKKYFSDYSSSVVRPLICTVGFILITHLVVMRGVRDGIEKASNLFMPILFVLLVIIAIASCSLPGAIEGIRFLFQPDFSKITSSTVMEALGQAFFSLSLGTACLCTYASYFSRQTNLIKSAGSIALIDTIIAILAGLMIFPAAFSVHVSPDSGPNLIFITLPNVFNQAFASVPFVGWIISLLFYILLMLAALTSTISMHEIGTAFFYEELHITRSRGAWIETGLAVFVGVFCTLSFGAVDSFTSFIDGKNILGCCDYLTSDILLPFGSFFTTIFIGWFVPKKITYNELTNWGTLSSWFYRPFLFLVRFVCPLCIGLIFLHQLGLI